MTDITSPSRRHSYSALAKSASVPNCTDVLARFVVDPKESFALAYRAFVATHSAADRDTPAWKNRPEHPQERRASADPPASAAAASSLLPSSPPSSPPPPAAHQRKRPPADPFTADMSDASLDPLALSPNPTLAPPEHPILTTPSFVISQTSTGAGIPEPDAQTLHELRPTLRPLHADTVPRPVPSRAARSQASAAHPVLRFALHRHTAYGSEVCVVGSARELGRWDERGAVAMQWTDGDRWTCAVPVQLEHVPAVVEYKYLVRRREAAAARGRRRAGREEGAGGEEGEDDGGTQWEAATENHRVEVGSGVKRLVQLDDEWGLVEGTRRVGFDDHSGRKGEVGPASGAKVGTSIEAFDGTAAVLFRVRCPTSFGETVAICGGLTELGMWKKEKAPVMAYASDDAGGRWEIELNLPLSQVQFEYKYLIWTTDKERRWEGSFQSNRIAMPFLMPRCAETGRVVFEDVWEMNSVSFSIFYPTDTDEEMHVTGDPEAIGAWFRPGPTRMYLGERVRLETDVDGQKWELQVHIPQTLRSFDYRYIIVDRATGATLWEREPNRKADFNGKLAINSHYDLRDVNFVGGMSFDFCPPNLFIGPYPQSTADIDLLKEAGVGAVLNVQTDEDFEHRQIRWNLLDDHYKRVGIEVTRFPITDFDRLSLRERLMGAVRVIDRYARRGLQIYIHCTAGMGRAPASAVAYLVWVHNWSLNDALSHVKKHRPVAVPNVPVLEDALSEPYRP